MADETTLTPVKFGKDVFISEEFQRGTAFDWRHRMKRRFQEAVEKKGYVLVGEVKMLLAPWTDMEKATEGWAEQWSGVDRFRLSAMFIPKESRG